MKKVFLKISLIFFIIFSISTQNSIAQMYWNNACSFDGSNSSYLSKGNSSSLNITGSFTIECLIKPENSLFPSFQTILQKREGSNAVGYTLSLSQGKISIRTNTSTRLYSSKLIQSNEWTHISVGYESSTGLFSISINGLLDTTATIFGASPSPSTDSLYIGKGFNSPFAGQLDEVRIWNRNLSYGERLHFKRLSLGTNTGSFNGLVLSLTFQDNEGNGDPFSLVDWSGNANNVVNRGVTAVDLSNRPSYTTITNECVELDGSGDYISAADQLIYSPQSAITLEAWIYPLSYNFNNVIVHKGTPNGVVTNYGIRIQNGLLQAKINNNVVLTSDNIIPLSQWSHIAFVYDGISGFTYFYINGKLTDYSLNNNANIVNGNDSLYIGGTSLIQGFDGYIDEFRLKHTAKSEFEINSFLFRSIDEVNDLPGSEVVYNFDGYLTSSVGAVFRMNFRNGASFSNSGNSIYTPSSPLLREDNLNFSEGFYLKTSDRRIPASGTMGAMNEDTLEVFLNENINDINVFVTINHTNEPNLNMTLFAPNGKNVDLVAGTSLTDRSDDFTTVFNDQADSSLDNGIYVSFSPTIKPIESMNSVFSGDNASGKWRLVINDNSTGDTGRLYGWGIQFNNKTSISNLLSVNCLIEGFYNPTTNLMSSADSVKFVIREISSPYAAIDSSIGLLQTNGIALASFDNVEKGIFYFTQIKHRNSIETWSSIPFVFEPLTSQASYDLSGSISKAFGNNMIQADNSPVRFAIYSGDVNQDGTVDLSDGSLIDNDAFNFASGYIPADVNGDGIVDLADAVFADNNGFNFVSKVTP